MDKIAAIILAAGKGVRMKSDIPKALCELSGRAMVEFLINAARACGIEKIVVVGGYKIALLKQRLSGHRVDIVEQKRLLGSADAVKRAEGYFRKFAGTILVLYADTPLIKTDTIKSMLKHHQTSKPAVTLLTGLTHNPKDYGRVLRDEQGQVCGIVEYTETPEHRRQTLLTKNSTKRSAPSLYSETYVEINIGAYCLDSKKLFEGLDNIKINRIKKEYYLTDIISGFYNKGEPIESYTTSDESEMLGINRREDLITAEQVLRKRIIAKLLKEGVDIKDPDTTHIQEGARIAAGATIYPFVFIDSDVTIGKGCKVGPFAHIRNGVFLEDGSEIGNFVEVVRSRIGSGSKAKHLTYIGDASIGKGVNIGAGTITANYDGKKKNRVTIDDKAFIGSGTTIIAPVRIGKAAVTGAGSVIIKGRDVPPRTVVVGVPARPLKK